MWLKVAKASENMIKKIQDVASKLIPFVEYGHIYWCPDKKEIFFVPSDSDTTPFIHFVQRALSNIPGVESVDCESEYGPKPSKNTSEHYFHYDSKHECPYYKVEYRKKNEWPLSLTDHNHKNKLTDNLPNVKDIAELVNLHWTYDDEPVDHSYDYYEFWTGLEEELEHSETVDHDWEKMAQIVLDHLDEDPEYYSKLISSNIQ